MKTLNSKNIAKQGTEKKKPVTVRANSEAKKDFTISTFWNKIQKENNGEDNIRNAYEVLKERENKNRSFDDIIKNVSYVVLINHFLPLYNDGRKWAVKTEKLSWYTFSMFICFVADMDTETYNKTLNFGLKHKPTKV